MYTQPITRDDNFLKHSHSTIGSEVQNLAIPNFAPVVLLTWMFLPECKLHIYQKKAMQSTGAFRTVHIIQTICDLNVFGCFFSS